MMGIDAEINKQILDGPLEMTISPNSYILYYFNLNTTSSAHLQVRRHTHLSGHKEAFFYT